MSRRSRQTRHSRPGSISLTINNDAAGAKPEKENSHHQSLMLDTSKADYLNSQLVLLASSQAYGIAETPVEYEETYRDQNTQQLQIELEEYQNAQVDMEVDQVTAKDSGRGIVGGQAPLNQFYNSQMGSLVTKNPYISDREATALNESRRSRASRSSRLSKQISSTSQKDQYNYEPQEYSQILSDLQHEKYKFYTPGSKADQSEEGTNTDLPMELSEITPHNDRVPINTHNPEHEGFDTIEEDNFITNMLDHEENTTPGLRQRDCQSNDSESRGKTKSKGKRQKSRKSGQQNKSSTKNKQVSTCKKSQEENKDPQEYMEKQKEAVGKSNNNCNMINIKK